jgi:hypothetical protein
MTFKKGARGIKKKATFAAFQLVGVLDVNTFLDALLIR